MWAGFVAYLGILAALPRLGGPARLGETASTRGIRGLLQTRVIWAGIVVLVTAFAVGPVLLSHDVYSYVDYARLGVLHGLDPYVHPPYTEPADPAFALVTWPEATSAYGPLFTLATYPLAWLSVGLAVAALKAAAALSVLGIAAIVARLAAWRGVDPAQAAAFVALNPLVLVQVIGGAHNDAMMMLVAMCGVAATLSARWASAGASLLAAVTLKVSAAFILPFALIAAATPSADMRSHFLPDTGRKCDRKQSAWVTLLAGAAAAALAIGLAAYLTFGWDWLHAFGLAGENQGRTSYMSIPVLTARLTGLDIDPVRVAALLLYAAAVAFLLVWTWRGADWVRAAAWAALGLLLATSWLLPWYLIWPLPLVAISRDKPLQLLTLALTAYQLGARIPL
jgi:Glycosyltransferase family 87